MKSLVLVCDQAPVVALVPGDRRADPDKVARALHATSARVATATEVEDATGFPPGGVAPFPLPGIQTVIMDHGLFRHALIWAGAGNPTNTCSGWRPPLSSARLARARPMDVVAERPYDLSQPKET